MGCDETTACFGDERHTESGGPIIPGRRDPSLKDGNAPTPSRSHRSLPPVSGPPFSFCPPLWVVSVVIYSSLPFILLLHLLVIHAYPQVHVPRPFFLVLCELLWPPSPCPRVTSTSKGVRVLVVRI